RRLMKPETSSVASMAAAMRNRRLLAEAAAATATSSMASANTIPTAVTVRLSARPRNDLRRRNTRLHDGTVRRRWSMADGRWRQVAGNIRVVANVDCFRRCTLYCVRCGVEMQENQQFCPACGTPVRGATTLMPVTGRIAGHIRLLGILWVALSAFRLIPGLALIALFGNGAGLLPPEVPFFVHGLLRAVGTLLVIGAALGLAAGAGLLQRQTWARM